MSSRWYKTGLARARRKATRRVKFFQKRYGSDHDRGCGFVLIRSGPDMLGECADPCTCANQAEAHFKQNFPQRRRIR